MNRSVNRSIVVGYYQCWCRYWWVRVARQLLPALWESVWRLHMFLSIWLPSGSHQQCFLPCFRSSSCSHCN